ncbi:MAG: Rrf2 family transcriptional regulator [Fimbriimonadales bacterium]
MMRLLDFGARTEYAVRTLAILAERGEGAIVTVKELAEQAEVSVHFLYTIFDILTRAGIVRQYRGVRRGFSLTRPATDITFFDIVTAIEGPLDKSYCLLDRRYPCRERGSCAAHGLWQYLREQAEQAMRSVTLDDIAHQNPPWHRLKERIAERVGDGVIPPTR